MDLIRDILINIFTSAVMLGAFAFIAKQYIEKWLTNKFEEKSIVTQHTLNQKFKVADTFLETELGIYPEILEVTYRLRNIMRNGLKQEKAYKWDPQLRPMCGHLTENLYKYRFFISEEIFEKLHRFKQISQDAIILRDTFTRDEKLFETEEYQRELEGFRKKYEEANVLYKEISADIRAKLVSYAKS